MPVKNVLVAAFDNLGDVVMATALVEPLRKAYPGARIGFWTKSYSARVLEGQGLDFVHAADPFWDRAPGRGKGGFGEFLGVLGQVRSVGYDAALVLNTEWRRASACRLAGVSKRVGYDLRKSAFFLSDAVKPVSGGHQTDAHRRLLEALIGQAVPAADFLPKLSFSEADRQAGLSWLERRGWKDANLVVIHPFTGDPLKTWPLPRWMELLQSLAGQDPKARFAVACSPSEQNALMSQLHRLPDGLVAPVVPLEEVRSLLSLARAFVGGDSGIGHMAAAGGVPVVSLFGPTSPERYAPKGRAAVRVIQKDPLSDLGVAAVAAEAKALGASRAA